MTHDLQTFIAESRKMCDAATDGPWKAVQDGSVCVKNYRDDALIIDKGVAEANREFIAHARTALPAALAHIERLAARVEELEIDNAALQAAITMGARLAVREQKVAQSPPETPKPRDICDEWADRIELGTQYLAVWLRDLGLPEMQAVVEAAWSKRRDGLYMRELMIALDALEAVKRAKRK